MELIAWLAIDLMEVGLEGRGAALTAGYEAWGH
jgi:hypothetical protein